LKYSQTVAQKCDQCESGFYSDIVAKTCTARTKLINNCLNKDPFSEKCFECSNGFQLKSDLLDCIQIPKNCEKIDEVSSRCIKCKPHFYLDTSFFCFFPSKTIEKCLIYKDPITCNACEDDHDLRNGECVPSTLYSSVNGNCDQISYRDGVYSCEQCSNGFLKIQTSHFCNKTEMIPNCKYYSSNDKCEECEAGFFLSNDECLILSEQNCEENDPINNICWKCGFKENLQIPESLLPGNSCISMQTILKKNCNQLNLNIKSPYFPCQRCVSPYIPFTIPTANYHFCLAEFQIEEINDNFKNQCLHMKLKNNKIEGCRKCQIDEISNIQLVIQNGRCLERCNYNKYLIENYNHILNEWFVCRPRDQILLRQCQNCRCLAFDSGAFVSSFLDTVVLDTSKKYQYSEMKDLITSSVKTGNAVSEHQICRQCPKGSLPVLNSSITVTTPSYSKYDVRPQKNINYFYKKNLSYFSFFNFIPEIVECTQYDMNNYENFPINPSILVKDIYSIYLRVDYSIFFNISDKSTLNNFRLCKGVNIGDNGQIGCSSCVFGYNGYLFNDTTEKINFMPECFFFYECKPEVYWRSLTSEAEFADLYYEVSCHQCKSLDQIVSILTFPVNFESLFEGENPTNYNITLTTLPKNFCFTPGILSGNADPSDTKFPLNCAIQEVLDIPFKSWDSAALDDNNPVCRVCKPKYKPVYYTRSVSNKRYVEKCELITNCAFSDEFNRCSQCEPGYVFEYAPIHALSDRQNCILNSIEHCEIADSDTTCLKCKDSFHLSTNGSTVKCLRSPSYYCEKEFSGKDSYFDTGCNTCLGQFYSVVLPFSSMNLCMENPEFLNSSCLVLDSDGTCFECKNGLYRVEGKISCVPGTISECQVYKDNGDCHSCIPGYILDTNKCVQGHIPGCISYLNLNECQECQSNMNLYKLNGSTICVDTSQIFSDCSLVQIDNTLTPPRASCQRCINQSFLHSISPVHLCIPFELDPLCKIFDTSTPSLCLECIFSSYLITSLESISGKKCIPRKNQPIYKCQKYKSDQDLCELCDDGFFLDVEGNSCLPLHYQIPKCLFYENDTRCFICKSGHVYKDDQCQTVTTPISNCKYQLIESECLICDTSFILSDDKTSCDSIDLSNESHKKLVCDRILRDSNLSGANLRIRLLTNSCFLNLQPNCFSYDSDGNCLYCEQNFFMDNFGNCSPVTSSIPNCQFYSSPNACSICSKGFFMSENGQHCLRGSFPKSFDLTSRCNQIKTKDNCVLCAPGYQIDPTTSLCSRIIIDSKCQVIDYDGTCLVCASGYQMNSEYACEENTHLAEMKEKIRVFEK
jgi:hypothetical protein